MELPCPNCHYVFSGQEMFDFHKTSCPDLQQKDPEKKKYLCPICDRQFRLLKNLNTHAQTIKHLDLLEWHHKQQQESLATTNSNIKEIVVTNSSLVQKRPKGNSNLTELEAALNFQNSSDDLSQEVNPNYISDLIGNTDSQDDFLSQLMTNHENEMNSQQNPQQNSDQNPEPPNDFLAQLMTSRDDLEIKLNQPEPSFQEPFFQNQETIQTKTIQTNLVPQLNDVNNTNVSDNFLDQLMNSREQELNNIQHELSNFQQPKIRNPEPQQQQPSFLDQLMQSRNEELNSYSNQNSNQSFHLQVDYHENEEGVDLSAELRQTKMELDADLNQHQAELDARGSQSDNPILNALNNIRERDILESSRQKDEPGIIFGQPDRPQKAPEYPLQFHQHPVWSQLSKIIKEKDAPRRLVAVMLGSPLSYYPIIYTFVRFSDRLKGKKEKELRLKLISSILEIQKHLIKILQAGQSSWGQKPVKQVLLVMSQWKVADYYRKLKQK